MKDIFHMLSVVMIVMAALATPISIVYMVWLWGGQGFELGVSAWEAVKVWFGTVALIIPALFIQYLTE